MRRIGLSLFLFFFTSVAFSFPSQDTLRIDSIIVDIDLKKASLAIGKKAIGDSAEELSSNVYPLPFQAKTDVVLKEIISYKGKTPVEIIIEPAGYHYVDIHLRNLTDGSTTSKKTGILTAFPENELRGYLSSINKVKMRLEPDNIYELEIFYRNPHKESIEIKLAISDRETWSANSSQYNLSGSFWSGIFFGTLVLLSFINFIFYYLFRDNTYMVYVGYILSILSYEAMLFGLLDDSFLKYIPAFMEALKNTALFLSIIFYLLFLKTFVNLQENYPRWNKPHSYLIIFLTILAISSNILFIMDRPVTGIAFRNVGLLFFIPIAFSFLVRILKTNRLIDRIFFAGSIFLVLSGLASIIISLSGRHALSDIYLQVGIVIEVIIFNIGLGYRSKSLQKEKDNALHQLILKLKKSEENQKLLNANLEQKVIERTHKINEINLELTRQRDQLFEHKETIEKNLNELNEVRKNLVRTVNQKTKELRRANKELVAQNSQLEQYTFITAHNLKAPVARLKGLINIYELSNTSQNPDYEIVSKIKEASLDMDEVIVDINKILTIKNFSQQNRRDIDIEKLVIKIEKRLEDKIQDCEITIEKKLLCKKVFGIDTYLESILYNLIFNGIKYSRNDIDSTIQISSYQKRKRAFLEIEDNGIGINLERYGDKIFGLYQRFHDHVNGKGIGLYLVKTQVEALQGKISVESKLDVGTKFKLSFPLS